MTRAHIGRATRGHTIIEAAIASGVFMFGVLGLMPLFYRSVEGVADAGKITQATALAQGRLAYLESQAYASTLLATSTNRPDCTNNLAADGTATAAVYGTQDGSFYRDVKVEEKDYSPTIAGNDFKIITVTVSWWDAKIRSVRSVSVLGGKTAVQ
jgi:Tfp pilus assembly protein PilV